MSNNTTPPTIAELWRELSALFERKKDCYCSPTASQTYRAAMAIRVADLDSKVEPLRAQLLERCGVVNDADGIPILFEVFGSSNIDGKPSRQLNIETKVNGNWCNPKELREISACAAFWAWELEQREKEAQP